MNGHHLALAETTRPADVGRGARRSLRCPIQSFFPASLLRSPTCRDRRDALRHAGRDSSCADASSCNHPAVQTETAAKSNYTRFGRRAELTFCAPAAQVAPRIRPVPRLSKPLSLPHFFAMPNVVALFPLPPAPPVPVSPPRLSAPRPPLSSCHPSAPRPPLSPCHPSVPRPPLSIPRTPVRPRSIPLAFPPPAPKAGIRGSGHGALFPSSTTQNRIRQTPGPFLLGVFCCRPFLSSSL